jgi:phosphatidate phosphatase APP1
LAPHELAVVVAVMSCEVAERAYPTREAIAMISDVDDTSMPSRLVREGWLERVGRIEGNAVCYAAAERAWRELEVGRVGV